MTLRIFCSSAMIPRLLLRPRVPGDKIQSILFLKRRVAEKAGLRLPTLGKPVLDRLHQNCESLCWAGYANTAQACVGQVGVFGTPLLLSR